ncbi:uncharacterized protein LOC132204295 isoform X2 [Neocloeon triangulifer]|uniref:uncharacterized protein LOC132204295 isoform X2 n=1 Tax=Neocloeon triangulifer TaxID=2078957 RepID=UPI00286ED5D9|nr:uncharacterized protein LOC132204295 isoform X2 [Neocloeon triangulifer]
MEIQGSGERNKQMFAEFTLKPLIDCLISSLVLWLWNSPARLQFVLETTRSATVSFGDWRNSPAMANYCQTCRINIFQKMVMECTGTEELRNAGLILTSRKTNLVPLKELCTRSIAVNAAKFSAFPERMSHLPPQLQSDILNCACQINSAAVSVVANSQNSLPQRQKVVIPLRVVQQLINRTMIEFDFALCPSNVSCFFDPNGVDFKLLQTLSSSCKGNWRIVD